MLRRTRWAIAVVAGLVSVLMGATAAQAAVWSSSGQWATWTNGGYTLYNDVWGSGAGAQTIWANSYSNWGVWANHPNTGGVKAYPNASKSIGKTLSALGSATSSFNVTVPGSGAYETAYDIWCNGSSYEIMLWMNKTGAVGPLGSLQTTATVGGHTWSVYSGSNGSNAVFSFVRSGNTSSATVDIKAVLNWIKAKAWFGDVTLSTVQFGYEITSSSGGLNFVTNSYSVTSS
jgi:Glycosyl hydrolase family 12